MAIFKGAGVAIVTPMNEDGSVNYEKFGELIEFQIANGTDAIIVCGTTGESSTLTHEEHLDTIKYCVDKVAKRIPVVAGTGSNCTDTAVYLSTDAKTLYGILLDRMSLSVKNGWLDEQNRVFIIFTIEDVKRALCCADNKATKLLRELEKFGLIERKRRGLGKPSLVYVKNFSAESSKSIFQNRDFHDSGGFKNATQDPSKSRCNKTKENDTEMSETDPFNSEEADGMSKRTHLEEYFSQSLEIDLLLRLCPDDKDIIYQIVDLLVDTCATNRKLLHIAGDDKPAEVVRSRFMKLNADHIRFVLKCLAENSSPIRNMKQYLLASLYNAPTTMQLSYQNQTNHDLAMRR